MKKLILTVLFTVTLNVFAQGEVPNSFKGKLAIGTNTTWIKNTALAARYYLTDIFGIEGFFSFITTSGNNNNSFGNAYVIGVKGLKIIKTYRKLNIYATSTIALHSERSSQQDVTLIGGLGLEWFVLNNLSLSSDCGLRLTLGNGFTRFASDVDNIPNISVKLYL